MSEKIDPQFVIREQRERPNHLVFYPAVIYSDTVDSMIQSWIDRVEEHKKMTARCDGIVVYVRLKDGRHARMTIEPIE